MCNMTTGYLSVSAESESLTSSGQDETVFRTYSATKASPRIENARRKGLRLTGTALLPVVAMRLFNYYTSWTLVLYACLSVVMSTLISMARKQRTLTRSLLSKVSSSENFKTEEAIKATTAKISSTIKRISSNQCWESLHMKNHAKDHQVMIFSDSYPFISMDIIEQLTLSDVTRIFQYAKSKNIRRHDTSAALEQVLTAIDASLSQSRGRDVIERSSSPSAPFTDIDALRFCAAVRIYGEWRVVRQVPEGYKGYATGMNLGKRDIVQNIGKIENAVHSWIDSRRSSDSVLRSPSLRELLQHEVDTNVHKRLPKLKEKTGAIGLVWICRQLQYQTCVYSNMLAGEYSEAASKAYKQVYDKYHGWAVQKMFKYSFKGAPPEKEIYNHMNPALLQQVTDKARKAAVEISLLTRSDTCSTSSCNSSVADESFSFDQDCGIHDWEVVPNITESSFMLDSDDEDSVLESIKKEPETKKNPFEQAFTHIVRETQMIGKNMERGWSEFVSSIANAFDKDNNHRGKHTQRPSDAVQLEEKSRTVDQRRRECFRKTRASPSRSQSLADDPHRQISIEMAKDAHCQMNIYLEVVQPMMRELSSLVEELNMNDPSKV